MLDGDKEGCTETPGNAGGEVKGPAGGLDKGPKEGALLTLLAGSLDGDEEGCAKMLGNPDCKVKGPTDGLDHKGPDEAGTLLAPPAGLRSLIF